METGERRGHDVRRIVPPGGPGWPLTDVLLVMLTLGSYGLLRCDGEVLPPPGQAVHPAVHLLHRLEPVGRGEWQSALVGFGQQRRVC